MWYIHAEPTENGNYGNPQSNSMPNAVVLPDRFLSAYLACKGFAALSVKDGTVTSVSTNQAALDAYNESHPDVPEPVAEPTVEERLATLEDALCEQDITIENRLSAIEDALCELDEEQEELQNEQNMG